MIVYCRANLELTEAFMDQDKKNKKEFDRIYGEIEKRVESKPVPYIPNPCNLPIRNDNLEN